MNNKNERSLVGLRHRLGIARTLIICAFACTAATACETDEDAEALTRLLLGSFAYAGGDMNTAAAVWANDPSLAEPANAPVKPTAYCSLVGIDADGPVIYFSEASPVYQMDDPDRFRRQADFRQAVINKYRPKSTSDESICRVERSYAAAESALKREYNNAQPGWQSKPVRTYIVAN